MNINLQERFSNICTYQLLSSIIIKLIILMTDSNTSINLIQCLYRTSNCYTLHDYTKLVTSIDGYLCVRQLVLVESPACFIRLNEQCHKVLHLHSIPQCIISVQKCAQNLMIVSYSNNEGIINSVNLLSTLGQQQLSSINIYSSKNQIIVNVSNQNDNQIIIINCKFMKIYTKCFIQGNITSLQFKENQEFSINFSNNTILCYQLIQHQKCFENTSYNYSILQKNQNFIGIAHCWLFDEIIIVKGNNQIQIMVNNKCIQIITAISKTIQFIKTMNSGFMICMENIIRIYKKKQTKYSLEQQLIIIDIGLCRNIQFTPQQQIMSLYDPKNNKISYCTTFQQQKQEHLNSNEQHKTLKMHSLCNHLLNQDTIMKLYQSKQLLFLLQQKGKITIYNAIDFKPYLEINMINNSELQNNSSCYDVDLSNRIECVSISIHPIQPIIIIALKQCVRVYLVLYDQLKFIKEIKLTNCKVVGFNHSGSIIHLVIGGVKGAKVYLYRTIDYQLMELLTVGKKILNFCWSRYDNYFYGIHQEGYFYWSIQSLFRIRHQSEISFDTPLLGGLINHLNQIILWSAKTIVIIEQNSIINRSNLKNMDYNINKILTIGLNQYLIAMKSGQIYHTQDLDITYVIKFNRPYCIVQHQSMQYFIVGNQFLMCVTSEQNIMIFSVGKNNIEQSEIVGMERRKIIKLVQKYELYDKKMMDLKDNCSKVIEQMYKTFFNEMKIKQQQFKHEMEEQQNKFVRIKNEKMKIQHQMQSNLNENQRQTMKQVKDIEKLYERKLALTTNKLLTSQQIAYRNTTLVQQKLKQLQSIHGDNIQAVRQQYAKEIASGVMEREGFRSEILLLKKKYEIKIYQLQQENEILLKKFQDKHQNYTQNLISNVHAWQNKFSKEKSEKSNIEKDKEKLTYDNQKLSEILKNERQRNKQVQRRCERLTEEVKKIENILLERNRKIQNYEQRISDLQKSNEILKYRVLELKNQNDPQEEEIIKLKENLTQIEEEYNLITKGAQESSQNLSLLKKENKNLKESILRLEKREEKIFKSNQEIMFNIRNTTKAPIQEIRQKLLKIVQSFDAQKMQTFVAKKNAEGSIEELNRMRQHLQASLGQVVDSKKKSQIQKKIEIQKKNRENSELLKQINDLRRKVSFLQKQIRERNLLISRISRGQQIYKQKLFQHNEKPTKQTNYQTQSVIQTKLKNRQTFYDKSSYKTHWRQNRLKTQHDTKRKKGSHSVKRQKTQQLIIQQSSDQIQGYKRQLDQKQTIIKQLLNKIQNLS